MAQIERDLRNHDDWAAAAVRMVHGLWARQQHNLLMHIFRTAAQSEQSGDKDAAISLCRDLYSTVALRSDPEASKALDQAPPPDRTDRVTLDEALRLLTRT